MDLKNIICNINEELENGLKFGEIEEKLKIRKYSLQKNLREQGYFYNKNKNKFIKKCNTSDNNNTIKTKEIEGVQQLTQEEIITLKKIAKKYIDDKKEDYNFTGNVTTRSFRSYKNIMDKFVHFCKKNNIVQKDALAIALIDYLNKK